MHRVGNKNKHASTLEHISYTFDIDGISRACLQELARHRHQSLSVKSTRYTLKELKDHRGDFNDFLVLTNNNYINNYNNQHLYDLQLLLQEGVSNDIAKYMLPEAYKTSLVSTMNMRALQNFLQLRTNKAALWEIQELARAMYEVVPMEHKFMLEEFVND
jgi:thymidylate synthase (FAD)